MNLVPGIGLSPSVWPIAPKRLSRDRQTSLGSVATWSSVGENGEGGEGEENASGGRDDGKTNGGRPIPRRWSPTRCRIWLTGNGLGVGGWKMCPAGVALLPFGPKSVTRLLFVVVGSECCRGDSLLSSRFCFCLVEPLGRRSRFFSCSSSCEMRWRRWSGGAGGKTSIHSSAPWSCSPSWAAASMAALSCATSDPSTKWSVMAGMFPSCTWICLCGSPA